MRFVKDLLWIGVFGIFFYVLTHNPISQPRIKEIKGHYSIQFMQHPLVLGIAGHNYLVLQDESSSIVAELHGLATDPVTNTWKYMGTKSTDILKVWEFHSSTEYLIQKNYPGRVLYQGRKDDTLLLWGEARECKEKINKKNIPYPPYGVKITGDTENSNSVAYTLTLCMGLDAKHLGLITPGSTRNLLR